VMSDGDGAAGILLSLLDILLLDVHGVLVDQLLPRQRASADSRRLPEQRGQVVVVREVRRTDVGLVQMLQRFDRIRIVCAFRLRTAVALHLGVR